jgi:uncharacterized membrane protein
MDWNPLLVTHVIAALSALLIAPINLVRRRRDRTHRRLGYAWVAAMYYVCLSSFGIVTDGRYSWLHGLSALTLVTVSLGVHAARRRNIPGHVANMAGSYLGLLIAFFFAAFVPSRHIPQLLASDPATAVVVALLVVTAVTALYLTVRPGGSSRPRRIAAGTS